MPKFGECPLPNPPPQGRERVAADFAISGNLKHSLGLQPLISGRLKNKKQPVQPIFLAEPLIPTATRPLSRGRELERGQQAARLVFGAVRALERLLQFGECPLPSPPPRGREWVAADSSVAGRLKKNARNINGRNFQVAFIARQMEQTPRAFFRRPLNPSVGCVPQGAHAVGWGCRENGERVRAYCTHPTCGLRLAFIAR